LLVASACFALLGLVLVGAVAILGVADGAAGAFLGLDLVGAPAAFLGGLNFFVEVLGGAELAAGVEVFAGAELVAGVEVLASVVLAFPASVCACCQREYK
jgi:hypothetical protein